MKKILITIIFILSLFSFASADKLDDAISWIYENGLSIHNNKTDFNADRGLRRDEAAKFFVNFSKIKGKTTYTKTTTQCTFSDINDSWSDLKDIVIESCRLGLFQGNNGKFNPKDQLSNVQAIAVLMRIIDGRQDEKSTKNRYDNYLNRSSIWNIANNTYPWAVDSNITRGNMAIMIYNGRLVDPKLSPLTKKEIGLIKQIYIDQNGNKKLEIDYVQFGGLDQCNGGVGCIINQNSKLRTFTVSNNVEIFMQTLSHTSDGNFNWNQNISFDYFKQKFNDTNQYSEYPHNYSNYLKLIPYRITIQDNIIIKIEEQYMS